MRTPEIPGSEVLSKKSLWNSPGQAECRAVAFTILTSLPQSQDSWQSKGSQGHHEEK